MKGQNQTEPHPNFRGSGWITAKPDVIPKQGYVRMVHNPLGTARSETTPDLKERVACHKPSQRY